MSTFMLLLHSEPASYADASPTEIEAMIAEYRAWREDLQERQLFAGGAKLGDDAGRQMTQHGELRIVDGPYPETKELLAGYFAVEVEDYDAAVALATECPHLKYGGRIEVRAVEYMHGPEAR